LRLVPKNLRNYLQTPTLIGCKFLTNPEATFVYFVLLCCDQRSLVVYHGFLSTVKLFSLSTSSYRTPQPSLRDAEAVSAEPSIMHCFFKPRQLRRKFFSSASVAACSSSLLPGAASRRLRGDSALLAFLCEHFLGAHTKRKAQHAVLGFSRL